MSIETAKRWNAANPDKARERSRISKAKARAEGRRDYRMEHAKAKGITVDEYAAGAEAKRRQALLNRFVAALRRAYRILTDRHDAHVAAYKKQPEYQRIKAREYYYAVDTDGCLKGHRKMRRLSDGYVASKLGLPLSILPAPLIELQRQLIKSRRVLNEIQQRK